MADQNRDVNLNVGVTTTGTDSINQLGKDFREVGEAGAASAADIAKYSAALDTASAATEEKRKTEAAARAAVDAQKASILDQRDALARLKLTTDDAGKSEQTYRDAVKAAQLALLDARAALRDKQTTQEAAASSARAAAAAEQTVREQLTSATAAYRTQQAAAASAAQAQVTGAKSSAAALEEMGSALRSISTLAQTVLGGQLLAGTIGQVAQTADSFKNLEARVKLAAGEGQNFTAAMAGVQNISQRTGTSLESTAALFTKLSAATKLLGLNTSDAIGLTETISQAIALSGESAQSSEAAIVQFAQGLQAGTLRGEDLNSVLEQAPRLAKALADGLGVTTGQLKQLGEAGALTSQQVIGALQGQSAALQAEFGQLPATVGRSITNLSSAWTVYIGEVDRSTGASATAAKAIDLLARNLDAVATVLISAGKAAAAWGAIKLAEGFIARATAAAAATTAVTANTAALVANAEASTVATAGVGKFAAVFANLRLLTLVGLVTNFREIGTAIGEWVAKLAGADKPLKDLEIATKADAEAARLAGAQRAAHAQALQLASDKALGLTDASRLLVAEFDKATKSGDSITEALGKVAKAMNLGDLAGITAAGAALDSLGVKGKASADQIKAAFVDALKGIDLGVFATEAAAAFDQSEQGARRLKAALDAVADESLRRVGTSANELKTGFSAAMSSALNDTDKLAATLKVLGATAEQTSTLLAKSLDKALDAAKTKEAVQAVIDRFEALGKQGTVSGEQLSNGLQKAKDKLDELKPGIDSLTEALHQFGLKSQGEAQAIADKFKESYRVIAESGRVSLADQRTAFDAWAAAAKAANKGVDDSSLTTARTILEIKEAAANAGKGVTDAMNGAGTSVDNLGKKAAAVAQQLAAVATTAGSIGSALAVGVRSPNQNQSGSLSTLGSGGLISLPSTGGQISIPAGSSFDSAAFNRDANLALLRGGPQPNPQNYIRPTGPSMTVNPDGSVSGGVNINPGASRQTGSSTSSMSVPSATGVNSTIGVSTVNLGLNVTVASQKDASNLTGFFKDVQRALKGTGR